MGWFNKSKAVKSKDIGKIANERAIDIIKQLSGKDAQYNTKRVIDNVITITGASGGTGASTIVANMAYLAQTMGLSVAVIDINILFPIQNRYFNLDINVEETDNDLVAYLEGTITLGSCINTINNIGVIYANNRNIADVINSESDIELTNFQSAIERLRQLYDVVIIDSPMSIENALVNTAFHISDAIYLVWDESITSIANAEKIRRNMMFTGISAYSKVRAILNKRTGVQFNENPFKTLHMELVGELPFDKAIIESGLRSEIFCKKGRSMTKTANDFYFAMQSITDKVLENGGYIQ